MRTRYPCACDTYTRLVWARQHDSGLFTTTGSHATGPLTDWDTLAHGLDWLSGFVSVCLSRVHAKGGHALRGTYTLTHIHERMRASERARDSARTRAWVWVRASACEWERRGQCWARLELILFFLIFLVSSLCVTVPWPGPAPPPPTRSPGRRHSALPSL